MKKLKVDPNTMIKSFPCSLLAAITLSIITLLFVPSYFSIIGICFYTIIYFPVYLLFIVPIQVLLNQNPRKFHLLYLLSYICGSLFASAIVIMINGENPFTIMIYYVISLLAAIVIWIFDSLILQESRIGE
ncbi:UPF0715 family protein [Lederbergia sp. NSJ-179]|uniref:UPF0715 family protein n=1 Tax=Lederbergia sp. NSJ-179 TaxID=2931402 RepID=UPI001FD02C2B|nr:UPF0715 family protein [Lederbergia sp. NSJ-179]MCJ7842818.1 UPF0715 family protein [Lederbergia sp. NSJ-179]